MIKKTAIITGVTGMDGSHLADFLLEKGYKVFGLKRRTSENSLKNAAHLENEPDFEIVEGDLTDLPSLSRLTKLAGADEFYNLAAMSHVGESFIEPVLTAQVDGLGVLNCLEAIKQSNYHTKFLQASTSELFGGQNGETFNSEETPLHPRSPYGVAKLFGHWTTVNYRESYKMFACTAISHNHESERRGVDFVTRKISKAVANIVAMKQRKLFLGNLDSKRDWGYAPDFVRGFWMIMNHSEPDDFVLATGESHSVREFLAIAFKHAKLGDYQKFVSIDPKFYRPAEVDILLGDSSKAKELLGWEPKITFEDLVKRMVDFDISLNKAK